MAILYFEDFEPGAVATYGALTVTRDDITGFASQFDPQPMHLDEAVATGTLLGGLAASGWHVCGLLMALNAQWLNGSASMGAPGIEQVRWLKPVRPGDVLSVRRTVLDARASTSKPDRGFTRFRFEMMNQEGDIVMEQINAIMLGRRPGGVA